MMAKSVYAAQYTLRVHNMRAAFENFAVFQNEPDSPEYQPFFCIYLLISLASFTKVEMTTLTLL
jgi:hypothetical protein